MNAQNISKQEGEVKELVLIPGWGSLAKAQLPLVISQQMAELNDLAALGNYNEIHDRLYRWNLYRTFLEAAIKSKKMEEKTFFCTHCNEELPEAQRIIGPGMFSYCSSCDDKLHFEAMHELSELESEYRRNSL